MRIVFVRHGQPNYELNCLTDLGRLQAQAAAERLREEGIEEIYSSPFGRALETAQYAARGLGIENIRILDFMHEIYWGSPEGKPVFANGNPWDAAEELMRLGFDLSRPDWTEQPAFLNNMVAGEAARVARELDAWLEGLGYRREGLYYRCTHHDARQRTVALFSHGGSSTCALAHLFNMTFPYACLMTRTQFTGVTVVRLGDESGSLTMPHFEILSDARHILFDPAGLEKD